jgi:hypothetical protein
VGTKKKCRRVNMVEIFCTHVVNGKMRPIETIPGMVGGRESRIIEDVNSAMMPYKNFGKYHIHSVQQ